MFNQSLFTYVVRAMVLLTAIPIHECAHAWASYKQGDPTAKNLGRLTLNPLPHLDLIGSILMIFTGFGWAKPVPVSTRYYKNVKKGMILTALAGPAANILLALLSKHQIDIYDINISDLLEQYMAYIRTLQEHQMEVASEFLEMASRLVYIKTASLLPRYEKEEDPRAELVGQLLEYQSCKQAAALLRLLDTGWSVFTRAPMPLEIDPTYRRRHPVDELTAAYWSACGRGKRRLPPQETAFTPLVTKPVVSVASRIMHLLRGFYRRGQASLQSIWADNHDRSELVATFMAVLELLKAGRVHLTDNDTELVFAGREKKKAEN